MFGRLLASCLGIGKLLLRFPHQRGNSSVTTQALMTPFSAGCTLGFSGTPYAQFKTERDALPWNLRSYFCEGHAMGIAGRSALHLRREDPDLFYGAEEFTVARSIGYGFWNGLSTRYPVPALKITGPLITNGSAYSSILARGDLTPTVESRILALQDPEARAAALHGAGRVLWLLYMNNFAALRVFADSSIAAGIGFAIGFIHAAAPDEIHRIAAEFETEQQRHIQRGIGSAYAVHACNDAESRACIENLATGELRDWYDRAQRLARDAGVAALMR